MPFPPVAEVEQTGLALAQRESGWRGLRRLVALRGDECEGVIPCFQRLEAVWLTHSVGSVGPHCPLRSGERDGDAGQEWLLVELIAPVAVAILVDADAEGGRRRGGSGLRCRGWRGGGCGVVAGTGCEALSRVDEGGWWPFPLRLTGPGAMGYAGNGRAELGLERRLVLLPGGLGLGFLGLKLVPRPGESRGSGRSATRVGRGLAGGGNRAGRSRSGGGVDIDLKGPGLGPPGWLGGFERIWVPGGPDLPG